MKCRPSRAFVLLCLAVAACAPAVEPPSAPDAGTNESEPFTPTKLRLALARDQLEDSFLGHHALVGDRARLYLAGYSGTLHVLARDVDAGLPLLQAIPLEGAVTALALDGARLWAVTRAGFVYRFALGETVTLERSSRVSALGLSDVVVRDGIPYVGVGQAHVAVDASRVFLTALNEGEVVRALNPESLLPTRVYGATFEANATVAFDRTSGERIDAAPNPPDLRQNPGFPAIGLVDGMLAQVVPGCCGRGLVLRDPGTLSVRFDLFRSFVNAVVAREGTLLAGTEAGEVVIVDAEQDAALDVLALREATGHTGSEDIEIRAVWADGHDRFVFAASSWGNDASRSPTLPSVFAIALE